MRISSNMCSDHIDSVRANCKKQLIQLLATNDIKLFDLIDPLLSDNQCQVHSIFVLNILLKCYLSDECCYDVNRLRENDLEILSDAVLLTLIKCEQIDGFGLHIRQESLEHFGGYFASKKKESKFIAQIKERFNTKAVDFMRKIAEKSVKRILDDCSANIPHSKIKLKILPCYATVYALMTHIKTEHLPILITLKRIELHGSPSAIKYRLNSTDIYYYKWDGGKFRCYENLNDRELNQPCVTFDSYSLYDVRSHFNYKYDKYFEKSKFPSHSFFLNCDIGHLIMASLATHFQLSESKSLAINAKYDTRVINPAQRKGSGDYIHSLYKKSSTASTKLCYSVESRFDYDSMNVYEQYLAHLSLAKDFNGANSQYSKFEGGVSTRRIQNAFFGVRHAYVSNYLREQRKKLSFTYADVELGSADFFSDVNKETAVLIALKKLEITQPGCSV